MRDNDEKEFFQDAAAATVISENALGVFSHTRNAYDLLRLLGDSRLSSLWSSLLLLSLPLSSFSSHLCSSSSPEECGVPGITGYRILDKEAGKNGKQRTRFSEIMYAASVEISGDYSTLLFFFLLS